MSTPGGLPRGHERDAVIVLAAASAVAALLWVVATPYTGIYHDAIVYALLVARWLDPAAFGRELFFAFGSQDAASVFTPLYGSLVRQFGLDGAARLTVAAGGLLWLGGCFALARAMFDRAWLVAMGLLFCAGLKLSFSPNFSTFAYNENFATARSLALPLGVFALAALVAGRRAWFWFAAIASTAIHPLHGIWLPILYVALALSPRQLMWAVGAGAMVLAGGAGLGVPPLAAMAGDWATIVRASSTDVFSGGWESLRLGDILLTIGVLWLAARRGTAALRELYLRLALLTALAILLFQACSDFFPLRLVMQVQPWRILWLAQLLAILAVCDLLGTAARQGRAHATLALALLAVAWALPLLRPAIPYLLLVLPAVPLFDRVATPVLAALGRGGVRLGLGAVLAAMLLPVYWLSLGIAGNAITTSFWPDFPELRGFLLAGGEGLALLLLAAALRRRAVAWAVLLVAAPAFLWEAVHWDRRSPAMRTVEAMYLSPAAAGSERWPGLPIRRGDVVAWYPNSLEVWTILRTPFYASTRQAIGIVFSEPRMAEISRRLERVSAAFLLADGEPLPTPQQARQRVLADMAAKGHDPRDLHKYGRGTLTAAGAAYLCADPVLDWVIVPHRTVAGLEGRPFDPGPALGGAQYVQSCAAVRARQGAVSVPGRRATIQPSFPADRDEWHSVSADL